MPLPSTYVEIRDGTRWELRLGEAARVQEPQVMRGYWNIPEETARSLSEDNRLRTGVSVRVLALLDARPAQPAWA